jgi:sialate O-acetylesterase
LRVAGSNTVTLRDILFGEVWVASGQSNMEWSVSRSNNPEQEIAKSDFPSIRFFQVKNTVADAPVDDVTGSWESCNPERTGAFSGVAYFFARDLHQRMRVPVGILQSDWGGTPAQAWTSKAALEADPRLHRYAENWSKLLANHPEAQARYEEQLAKWKQAAEEAKAAGRTPAAQPRPPMGPGSPHTPSGLYNAMIAPLAPFTIRGVIWYQGESNAGRVDNELYRLLFPAMIQDWRNAWNQGAFPFLFVQLANFAPPAAGTWPVLRESQLATLELRNTGMAVATDVGDSNDIHPKDKQTVGTRLALAARAIAYGEKITYSGPVYRQAATERGEMRLWFDHTGSGLRARGDKLTGFEIAGADRRFVPAEARIDGATVIVSSPQVQSPAAVRYAWANDPVANLINAEGLPATPFRTDRWPVE